MEKKGPSRWRKGVSGNPKGRPRGTGHVAQLRQAIEAHVPVILTQLVAAAKGGDVGAARLLLERVLPPIKSVEQAVALQLPEGEGLTAQGSAVLSAVACGELAPSQGAALLGAIGQLARVTEIDSLADRIKKLELNQIEGTRS